MSPGRWRRTDWANLGLEQLSRHGPSGVTVESLCAASGRTRGSLYHHFGDHHEFLLALVALWRERFTEAVITAVRNQELSGRTGASHLNRLAIALDAGVEIGIRQLAAGDGELAARVADVDRRRIDFLTELHLEAGAPSGERARAWAELEYAAFVGSQHMRSLYPPERLSALYRQLDRLVTGAMTHRE